MAKAVSIAESLEIQKTASNRMKEALAKQAADRLSKSETTTDGTGYSNISHWVSIHMTLLTGTHCCLFRAYLYPCYKRSKR